MQSDNIEVNIKFKMKDLQVNTVQFSAVSWDKSGNALWSKMIYSVLENENNEFIDGTYLPTDINLFCPRFNILNREQKMNFWGQFLASVSFEESSWKPTAQYIETTQGIDPMTGLQSKSEGLLQLSYKDQQSYRIDCGFDWSTDKQLRETDARKTIFDPYQNLRCGIKILSYQLKNYKSIVTKNGNQYWQVLKPSEKLEKIKKSTLSLPFCN